MPVQRMLPRLELNQNSSRPQIQQILGTRAEDQGCSVLELTEVKTGVIREVEETASSREGEPDMDVELASDNKQFQGSDISAPIRNSWRKATNSLLRAGQYLESETKNKKYLMPSSEQKCYDDSEVLRDQVRISVWWARQVLPIPRMNQNYTQIC